MEKDNAGELIKVVSPSITKGTKKLILAKMKFTNEEIFAKAIAHQMRTLDKIGIIRLYSTTEDAMFYIKEKIIGIHRVQDIFPQKNIETTQEWNITCELSQMKQILK